MNTEQVLKTMERLLAISSPTGYYRPIQDFLVDELTQAQISYSLLRKGGIIADAGGEGNALCIMVHADEIGLMVRWINSDGTLDVTPIGGLFACNVNYAPVRVMTRCGRHYQGTVYRKQSNAHVTPKEIYDQPLDYDKNVVVVLDEDVRTQQNVLDLGIRVGDFVGLSPEFRVHNGFIKSRFIDNKANVAVCLELLKRIVRDRIPLNRKVLFDFTMFEEVRHGGAWVPEGVTDVMAIDIACVGERQTSKENKVSIFAKDGRFPYNYELVNELISTAEKAGVDYVVDVFTPFYGSDADVAVTAGHDVRHGAIGPGTIGSHGYERTHVDALKNTYHLILQYIRAD